MSDRFKEIGIIPQTPQPPYNFPPGSHQHPLTDGHRQQALPPGSTKNTPALRSAADHAVEAKTNKTNTPPTSNTHPTRLIDYLKRHPRAAACAAIGALAATGAYFFPPLDYAQAKLASITESRQYSDAAINAPDCTAPLAVADKVTITSEMTLKVTAIPTKKDREKYAGDPTYKPTEVTGFFDGTDNPDNAMPSLQQVPMSKEPFGELRDGETPTMRTPLARFQGAIAYSVCAKPDKNFYKIQKGVLVVDPTAFSIQPRPDSATVKVETPTIAPGDNPAESPFTKESIDWQNLTRTDSRLLSDMARYTTMQQISSQCIPQIGKLVNDGIVDHIKAQTKLPVRFGPGNIEGPNQWLKRTTNGDVAQQPNIKFTPHSGDTPYECGNIHKEEIR